MVRRKSESSLSLKAVEQDTMLSSFTLGIVPSPTQSFISRKCMREVCSRGISYTAEPSPQPSTSRCPWLSLLMMAWISHPNLADSKFCDLVKLLKSPCFSFPHGESESLVYGIAKNQFRRLALFLSSPTQIVLE